MRRILTLVLALLLAAGLSMNASAVDIVVDGVVVEEGARVINGSTYVSLRSVAQALRADLEIYWEGQAVARGKGLLLTARPGQPYIEANGRALFVPDGVLAEYGRTLVPVRTLARALDAEVAWDQAKQQAVLTRGGGAIQDAASYYKEDELYWLSRIISSESGGEPLLGKVAVGNVVLNRVESHEFPDTVYGVIFDGRWGGQFEPVRNGTVYNAPTKESILAAKLCLDGADVSGNSLYFLAPALTGNHWIMNHRPYVMTIGAHWFYR